MIESIRIVRFTRNFKRMRSFYVEALDMRPVAEWDRGPDDKGVILVFTGRTSTTSVEVLMNEAGGKQAAANGQAGAGGFDAAGSAGAADSAGISVAIEVDNVGAQHETLVRRGVHIEQEPENMPWGHRRFVVRDPDGLAISFFQDMNRPEE